MKSICNSKKILFEDILNNKDKYSKEFSESEPLLEEVLKLLWNNNIETIGCCKGHDNYKQYIGFRLDNIDKIIKLLSSLDKKQIQISFVKLNNKINVSIRKYGDIDIYNNIKNALNKDFEDSYIKNIITKLLNNTSKEYFNIHLYYKDNVVSEYLNTTDLDLIKEYKNKYEYKILNEKTHMYNFKIR